MSLSFSEIAHAHKEFIQHTLQSFEEQLLPSATEDAELVTRAMFSVRNQAIKPPHYSRFSQILVCQVQDVNTAEVTINFPEQQIGCSCPKKELCRHQLAVILKLSQYFISLQQWLSIWRSKRSVPLQSLASERSPENWQMMADEVLNYAIKGPKPLEPYTLSGLIENIRTKLQRHRPYEQEWQELFNLFMDIAVSKHFLLHAVKTKTDLSHHYVQFFLENTLSRIQRSIDTLSRTTRLFATEPFFDAIQKNVHEILFIERGATAFRLSLYLQFWTKLFNEQKRLKNELVLLEQSDDSNTDIELNVVKSIFYILLSSPSQLEHAVGTMNENNVEGFIDIAQYALQKEFVDEATVILKKALPFLQTFVNDNLLPIRRQKFTRKLDHLYGQVQLSDDEELALYSSFGRYGIESFSNYLLRHNRLDEWVALHQLYPSSISYLDQCGLKDVVAQSPGTALPLYHFYAMEEIQQKSRQNYKQAVRIWRAMKSASKKAGKLDYFTAYIEAVQQQYKRLRALQEEINKSNLLI